MGFFKDLKNKVTGGAATVTVNVPAARRGQIAEVKIQATAKANGKASAIYLLVRATESCEIKGSHHSDPKFKEEKVRGRRTSYEHRFSVAGATELKEGQTYDWNAQIELPTNVGPSLNGEMIDHEWEIQAGLDMAGNDPDSGFKDIR